MTLASLNARRFFFILLLVATVLMAMLARPIASALFLGGVLAGVLWPLHRRLSRHLWHRRSLSAALFVVAVTLVIVGPVVAFSAFAIKEGAAGVRFLSDTLRSEGAAGLVQRLPKSFQSLARQALQQIPGADGKPTGGKTDRTNAGRRGTDDTAASDSARDDSTDSARRGSGSGVSNGGDSDDHGSDGNGNGSEKMGGNRGGKGSDEKPGNKTLASTIQEQVTARGGKAAAVVGTTLSAMGSLLFQAVMMLVAMFFFLMQGDEFVVWLDEVSPLRKGQTRELLSEFKKVSYAVIMSTVITSAIQAAVALIGYFIARVPQPIFFAGVTFFVAFIPALGAAAVCLAAALLLVVTGHPYFALFLALWGVLVVGLVDNVVKPFLIKAGMELQGAVVFFALIGGIGAFGAVGLLLGPLVVALFLALLRMYKRDFKDDPVDPAAA